MQINKKKLDIQFIQKLMRQGIDPIVLSILNRRGFSDIDKIIDFLYPVFERIDSPFHFKDIIRAYKRLDNAIRNGERILIYGDKDVDGTTSIALIYDFLKEFTNNVEWDLPIEDDAYGVVIDKLKNKNFDLLITVDCGIANYKEIEYLNKKNINTIIIDHHSTQENNIPDAYAIINPKNNESFPIKEISASGLSFLFILGYYFYNSNYFNKRIGVVFFEDNKLILNIYKNLLLIDSQYIRRTNSQTIKDTFNIDLLFSYNNKYFNIGNDIFSLPNIENIYKELIFYKSESIKAEISLFNYIYNNIQIFGFLKEKYFIYSMFGLIADIVPIINTNRIIIKEGLKFLRKSSSSMIQEMIKKLNLEQEFLTSIDLAWRICPLLNASGRMGQAQLTVETLLNYQNNYFVEQLLKQNEERKKQSDIAYNLFVNDFNNNKKEYQENLTFFYSEKISKGVTGLTATKLSKENNNCPTIVASRNGDLFTGSIRGDTNYHFVDFLTEAKDILLQFGGHKVAAGFSLRENRLKDFVEFLKSKSHLLKTDNNMEKNSQEIFIDAEIPLEYFNINLLQKISLLEPFGQSNPNPILYTKKITIINYKIIGKNKEHLKITFATEDDRLPSIVGLFWKKGQWFDNYYEENMTYDIVYKIEYNHYNGQVIPQLILIDIEKNKT